MLTKILRALDCINSAFSAFAHAALWLLTLGIFALAIAFKAFSYANSQLDDATLYAFALLVLLSLSATLREGRHVRVDLLFVRYSPLARTLINFMANAFFILPFSLVLVKYGLDFTLHSYAIGEASQNGKIPYYFVFKSFIVLGFLLLAMQAVSQALKSLRQIREIRG